MGKKRIYIAGKLNDDAIGYIKNMHRMIKTAKLVRDNGYSVYVPCVDILEGIVDGDFGYGDYFDNSQPWLDCAHAIFLTPGWEKSSGTKKEIERAETLDIPVFKDIKTMNNYFHGVLEPKLF